MIVLPAMECKIIDICLNLLLFFFTGTYAVAFTITNNCAYTVWPGTLAGGGQNQLPTTGFELASKASSTIDAPANWFGRFWGRTGCSDSSGNFACATADCVSGSASCNGGGAIPPATLVEITLSGSGNQDFYNVSLVDGFNIPASIAPQGGSGACSSIACPADVNAACPAELQVNGSDGRVIACKSACLAFKTPEYCCTGDFASPDKCPPSQYAQMFKSQCPQDYSYAYDDKTSTFTCGNGANYAITFCP